MIASLIALAMAQAQTGPWTKYQHGAAPAPERLGPGPHTLVISHGEAITRMDYRTGSLCQRARDEIRRQVTPPVPGPDDPLVYYGPPRTKAFCVPR